MSPALLLRVGTADPRRVHGTRTGPPQTLCCRGVRPPLIVYARSKLHQMLLYMDGRILVT